MRRFILIVLLCLVFTACSQNEPSETVLSSSFASEAAPPVAVTSSPEPAAEPPVHQAVTSVLAEPLRPPEGQPVLILNSAVTSLLSLQGSEPTLSDVLFRYTLADGAQVNGVQAAYKSGEEYQTDSRFFHLYYDFNEKTVLLRLNAREIVHPNEEELYETLAELSSLTFGLRFDLTENGARRVTDFYDVTVSLQPFLIDLSGIRGESPAVTTITWSSRPVGSLPLLPGEEQPLVSLDALFLPDLPVREVRWSVNGEEASPLLQAEYRSGRFLMQFTRCASELETGLYRIELQVCYELPDGREITLPLMHTVELDEYKEERAPVRKEVGCYDSQGGRIEGPLQHNETYRLMLYAWMPDGSELILPLHAAQRLTIHDANQRLAAIEEWDTFSSFESDSFELFLQNGNLCLRPKLAGRYSLYASYDSPYVNRLDRYVSVSFLVE